MSDLLHPVADSQHRDSLLLDEVPHLILDVGGVGIIDRGGSPGENDSRDVILPKSGGVDQTRVELTEDMNLADSSGDEVAVLGPEVQDGDLCPGGVELRGERLGDRP